MKELDVLLGRFAAAGLAACSDSELASLEALLDEPEARLLDWLTGRLPPPAHAAEIVTRIREAAGMAVVT